MTADAAPLFDLHCHLDLFPDPAAAFEDCRTSRLVTLSVTTTPRAWARNCQWARGNPFVLAALGLHPELVASHGAEVDQLVDLMKGVSMIGETGLDGSAKHRGSYESQLRVFRKVVATSVQEPGRILSIHSRSAVKDVLTILQPYAHALRPVLHWFLGTTSEVKAAADLGCYFSVNQTMSTSKGGRAVITAVPIDRLLLESDAPFRREAATIAGRIADLHGAIATIAHLKRMALGDVKEALARNSIRLLGSRYTGHQW
jgi:TatD DNase family protein